MKKFAIIALIFLASGVGLVWHSLHFVVPHGIGDLELRQLRHALEHGGSKEEIALLDALSSRIASAEEEFANRAGIVANIGLLHLTAGGGMIVGWVIANFWKREKELRRKPNQSPQTTRAFGPRV